MQSLLTIEDNVLDIGLIEFMYGTKLTLCGGT